MTDVQEEKPQDQTIPEDKDTSQTEDNIEETSQEQQQGNINTSSDDNGSDTDKVDENKPSDLVNEDNEDNEWEDNLKPEPLKVKKEDEIDVNDIIEEEKENTKTLKELKSRVEVSDFIEENPEAKEYKKSILNYKGDPRYANLPMSDIFKIVAGERLMSIGAKKERQASQRVKASQSVGSQSTSKTKAKADWSDPSLNYEQEYQKLMQTR